jgi:hypothetical protein
LAQIQWNPSGHFDVTVHRDLLERPMVAEMQRLENAARMAMGDMQGPDQTTPQPSPLSQASISLIVAVLAVIGAGVFAFALI